ncbi:MAG: hypothetical protein JWM16_4495 [Verrucomicrobiales bacterium]|nr:hypothetical protein [Verrucomicrobiales bacterium]
MQIDQVILRPKADAILLQHTDSSGRSGITVVPFDEVEVPAALAEVLRFCEKRMPPEREKPAQEEIQQEIAELEYRLEHLRKSIGGPQVVEGTKAIP